MSLQQIKSEKNKQNANKLNNLNSNAVNCKNDNIYKYFQFLQKKMDNIKKT